jgi:hypothetical protein
MQSEMNEPQTKLSEEWANTVTSGAGLVFAVVGAAVLITMAVQYGTVWHIVSCSVYAGTLIFLYTDSTRGAGSRTNMRSGISSCWWAAFPISAPFFSSSHRTGYDTAHHLVLTTKSFVTDSTPWTPRAISAALSFSSWVLANPLNRTTPLKVVTWTANALTVESVANAAFTLAVIAELSKYSPVLSCVRVLAQPVHIMGSNPTDNTVHNMRTAFLFLACMAGLLLWISCLVG